MRKTRARTEPLVLNTNPPKKEFKLPPVDPRYRVKTNTVAEWGVKREWPPASWNHWAVFGLEPTLSRFVVIERYHELQPSGQEPKRKWEIEVAYGRILSELWAKGVYPSDY